MNIRYYCFIGPIVLLLLILNSFENSHAAPAENQAKLRVARSWSDERRRRWRHGQGYGNGWRGRGPPGYDNRGGRRYGGGNRYGWWH